MRMTNLKRIRLAALGLVATVTLLAPAAYAQSPQTGGDTPAPGFRGRRGPGGPGMGMPGGLWSQLDLTDAQKAQLKQVRANHHDAIQQLSQQLATMHQQLNQQENGTTFDEDLATKQLIAMAGIEAKLMGERFKINQESMAILTPDQKTKLQQLQQQMKAKWAERRAGQPPSSN